MNNNVIIGRKQEQKLLQKAYTSMQAEFLAVFGRRRVGKTYLIESFFSQASCTYFQLTGLKNGALLQHLNLFSAALGETFFANLGIQINPPKSWMEAFNVLTRAINNITSQQKIILFFDEIPWLASKKSGFKEALDHYWNTKWSKDNRIILIICGSAASWIVKNILNDKGGLHNRVTCKLLLYPFSLEETFLYLTYLGIKTNHRQVLELYMALGGIPHYLKKIEKGLSATQNISKLCFSRGGELIDEFEILFESLFSRADAYIELIKIIASKRYGIPRTEIISKAKLSNKGGTLTERLLALEQAGFITSFIPIGYTERGATYKVIDEYCLFYLSWIAPIKKQIKRENVSDYWSQQVKTPAWKSWSGYAYETICLKHIAQIKNALFIPPNNLSGSWSHHSLNKSVSHGAQIDLLFDRDDGVITICEIKYTQASFEINKNIAADLQKKIDTFKKISKTNKIIYLAMITTEQLKVNRYSQELITGNAVLEDLFKET